MFTDRPARIDYLIDWRQHHHCILRNAIQRIQMVLLQALLHASSLLLFDVDLHRVGPITLSIAVKEFVKQTAGLQIGPLLTHFSNHDSQGDPTEKAAAHAVQIPLKSPKPYGSQTQLKLLNVLNILKDVVTPDSATKAF